MERVIPLPKPDQRDSARTRRGEENLFWSRRASLTSRILAVNIIALGLMAGSLFYLDSYRNQLVTERFRLARGEAEITADALARQLPGQRRSMLARVGSEQHLRLRLFAGNGTMIADSFDLAPPSFRLIDPAGEPWYQHGARLLDRAMDFILGAPAIADYHEPGATDAGAWPELDEARVSARTAVRQRLAPDRTPVITAAAPVGESGTMLLATRNATDITQKVRDARQTLAIIVGVALLVSIQLSLFLARTIVQPLRMLVRAAVRVRLGRDREVIVPRLPERGDEIGLLARAISDMTTALRQRIDAVESFAADVAHEIKNPLASLRSALESLDRVDDPELRGKLMAIAGHDVRRIDRLVTEIADASRIDAELSRTAFEPVDMAALARALVDARQRRGANADCRMAVQAAKHLKAQVAGDASKLERVLENLLDNAVSFSPPKGKIAIGLFCENGHVQLVVTDDGPGIPAESRERIFERFHSLRPEAEDFGRHSGLGLAIARTIVEAHDGTLVARGRAGGLNGAEFVVALPQWSTAG